MTMLSGKKLFSDLKDLPADMPIEEANERLGISDRMYKSLLTRLVELKKADSNDNEHKHHIAQQTYSVLVTIRYRVELTQHVYASCLKKAGDFPLLKLNNVVKDLTFFYMQFMQHTALITSLEQAGDFHTLCQEMTVLLDDLVSNHIPSLTTANGLSLDPLATCHRYLKLLGIQFSAVARFFKEQGVVEQTYIQMIQDKLQTGLQTLDSLLQKHQTVKVDFSQEEQQTRHPELYATFVKLDTIRQHFINIEGLRLYQEEKIDPAQRKLYRQHKRDLADLQPEIDKHIALHPNFQIYATNLRFFPCAVFWDYYLTILNAKIEFFDALLFLDNNEISEQNEALIRTKLTNCLAMAESKFIYTVDDPPLVTTDVITLSIEILNTINHYNNPCLGRMVPFILGRLLAVTQQVHNKIHIASIQEQKARDIFSALEDLLKTMSSAQNKIPVNEDVKRSFRTLIAFYRDHYPGRYIPFVAIKVMRQINQAKEPLVNTLTHFKAKPETTEQTQQSVVPGNTTQQPDV